MLGYISHSNASIIPTDNFRRCYALLHSNSRHLYQNSRFHTQKNRPPDGDWAGVGYPLHVHHIRTTYPQYELCNSAETTQDMGLNSPTGRIILWRRKKPT